jgi:ABC-type phosphate transport system substrate-binding protein
MKRIALTIATVFTLTFATNAWAEGATTGNNGEAGIESSSVRYVRAPRFVRPLVEKWISEYAKTHSGVEFRLASGPKVKNDISLDIIVEGGSDNPKAFSDKTVYFGETALLPITARNSEASRLLEGKRLNSKKIRQLFFINDEDDDDEQKNKVFEQLTVYSGSNSASVGNAFARSYGENASSFRGRRISGDDLFLNTALQKDPLGVSFNALSNIFDLDSRSLKSALSLVALDVKKEYQQAFSNQATLDEVLSVIETSRPSSVVVEKIGASYDGSDAAVGEFLAWVLESGVAFNHDYGVLNLDASIAQAEAKKIDFILTAQK